jgi:hypothetical protein
MPGIEFFLTKVASKKIVFEKVGYNKRNKTILIFFIQKRGYFFCIIFLDEFDRNKIDNL